MRFLGVSLFQVIGLVALTSCAGGARDSLVLSGTIEADTVHAGSRVGGRVAEVFVEEGQHVSQGDVILELEKDALLAQKAQLEAVLTEAEAAYQVVAAGAKPEDIARARQEAEALRQTYELARAGPLPEEIAAAESQAESLRATYQSAQDAADRMERLFAEGVVSERELITARQAAEAARNQWQAALQQVEALKSRPREEEVAAARARYLAALEAVRSLETGATPEQLASARARIESARTGIERLEVELKETVITAPAAGLLDSFDLRPGDFISPGQPVCRIVDLSELEVRVYVPENQLGFVREGTEVEVRVDSYPGEVFSGTITTVAAEAEFTPRNVQTVEERVSQVFAVTVSVPNPQGRLRPGMAADVTISLK